MQDITVGQSHTSTLVVGSEQSAAHLGSGNLAVLGTPAMAALMENAAMLTLAPSLDENESSVGTALNISHDRATRIGDTITATATVTTVEGRRIDFVISASDSSGETIGKGTHTRFVIDVQKFMAKIEK